MKKIIVITAAICLTALCCFTMSFLAFDLSGFKKHLKNTDRNRHIGLQLPFNPFYFTAAIGYEHPFIEDSERMYDNLDSIGENTDNILNNIGERTDELSEKISEKISDDISDGISNILENGIGGNIIGDISGMTNRALEYGLFASGAKDGYIDKKWILKNKKHATITDTVSTDTKGIESIEINLHDTDLVLGKSKSDFIELYLLQYKKHIRKVKLDTKIKKGKLNIGISLKKKNWDIPDTVLYVLIPDNCTRSVNVNSHSADIVSLMQRCPLSIKATNSDVVISQDKSCDLDVQSTNGDIVLTTGKMPDAHIIADTVNGSIISPGSLGGKSIDRTLGDGKASIKIHSTHGSIIIS